MSAVDNTTNIAGIDLNIARVEGDKSLILLRTIVIALIIIGLSVAIPLLSKEGKQDILPCVIIGTIASSANLGIGCFQTSNANRELNHLKAERLVLTTKPLNVNNN